MPPINLVAVLFAAVSAFVLGFLFHGPVFGKLWMRLANIHPTGNEKVADMLPQLFWNFVVNLITALTLALVYMWSYTSPFLGGPGISTGMIVAFHVWLGFLVTTTSIEVIWMGRTLKLWLFEACASLVVMLVMGAIIGYSM